MLDTKLSGVVLLALFSAALVVSIYLILIAPNPSKKDEGAADFKTLIKSGSMSYPNNTIAVLNIMSPISYAEDASYFSLRREGALYWIDMLKSIENNPNVKAVILRINSPGGTVAATQEVFNQVKKIREKGKLVTVSMGDIAASGAYYIACAADYIVANPGTLTGSIGVIMAGLDLSELFKKFGVGYNVIKSGKNKDLLANYRKMTPEEKQLLEDVIMDTYQQFFDAVATGRKLRSDVLKPYADGRIFSGNQALQAKLVDELGDFEKTIQITAKMADIPGEPNVVEIKPEVGNIFKMLGSSFAGRQKAEISLIEGQSSLTIKGNYSPVLYMTEF